MALIPLSTRESVVKVPEMEVVIPIQDYQKIIGVLDKAKNDEMMAIAQAEFIGDIIFVTGVWFPKQEISGGRVELDDDWGTELITSFTEEERNNMRVWIHSHPFGKGGDYWSGTDEKQVEGMLADGFEWVLSVLFHGSGVKAAYSTKHNIHIDDLPVSIAIASDKEAAEEWDKKATKKVSVITTTYPRGVNFNKTGNYTKTHVGGPPVAKDINETNIDDWIKDEQKLIVKFASTGLKNLPCQKEKEKECKRADCEFWLICYGNDGGDYIRGKAAYKRAIKRAWKQLNENDTSGSTITAVKEASANNEALPLEDKTDELPAV